MILLAAATILSLLGIPDGRPSIQPCQKHSEWLKHGHMDIGVRFIVATESDKEQWEKALNFWSSILDMDWYENQSNSCAMQIVLDNTLGEGTLARSQFPDSIDFEGLIRYSTNYDMDEQATYLAAIHEIGHMLGLRHSKNKKSLMFPYDRSRSNVLTGEDLWMLQLSHELRVRALAFH